jgi:transposase-like protein
MNDPRRAEARRLRATTRMSLAQLREHLGVSRDTLADWLWNEPVPAWTRRPNAKDELRAQAVQLRTQGRTVPEISAELGVAKSTAYQWVKQLPLDATVEQGRERRRRHSQHMTDTRWEPHRQARDAERAAVNDCEVAWVGKLSDREVLLLGATVYWCEGAKAKPWRPNRCQLHFINSDPALVLLFIRFIEQLGVHRTALHYRLSIHESADIDGAAAGWASVVGVPVETFQRPTPKKHNPSTVRFNTGESYRGCLMVYVPRSRRLYWKVEGVMRGIALATVSQEGGRMFGADIM